MLSSLEINSFLYTPPEKTGHKLKDEIAYRIWLEKVQKWHHDMIANVQYLLDREMRNKAYLNPTQAK